MTPEAWAAIIGVFMPIIISFLKNCDWREEVKFGVSLLLCLAVGGATAYFSGQLLLKPESIFVDGAIVFTAAQTVYQTWFKWTKANEALESVKIL